MSVRVAPLFSCLLLLLLVWVGSAAHAEPPEANSTSPAGNPNSDSVLVQGAALRSDSGVVGAFATGPSFADRYASCLTAGFADLMSRGSAFPGGPLRLIECEAGGHGSVQCHVSGCGSCPPPECGISCMSGFYACCQCVHCNIFNARASCTCIPEGA
jgi:hypothetical protein